MLLCLWIIIHVPMVSGLTCVPTLSIGSNSKPDVGGYLFIECEISTCADIHIITYEKTGVGTSVEWTPVYEGFNKTYFHALDTGTEYTLENRNDYTAFPTKHILSVQPLILQDDGEWRCVVHDGDINYQSRAIDVIVYVTPNKDSIIIWPRNQSLVAEQATNFNCEVNGIHPEPKVVWKVNGEERYGGTISNTQREDGLWSVNSTIQVCFDIVGINIISCTMEPRETDQWRKKYIFVMQISKTAPWLTNNISIDVKEPAKILYPQEHLNITVIEDSAFTLNCIGTGYKPYIAWTKNGIVVAGNDSLYNITNTCNDTTCTSFLVSIFDETVDCLEMEYATTYNCVITLEPPYESSEISPKINVYGNICETTNILRYIVFAGISMLILTTLILIIVATVCCLRKKNQKQKDDNSAQSNTENIEMQHSRTPNSEMQQDVSSRHDDRNIPSQHVNGKQQHHLNNGFSNAGMEFDNHLPTSHSVKMTRSFSADILNNNAGDNQSRGPEYHIKERPSSYPSGTTQSNEPLLYYEAYLK